LLFVLAALCVSCEKPRRGAEAEGLSVAASFYTMADFAQKIGGERARVRTLIQGGEAHDWEPSPRDIAALAEADVFIVNGAGMEPWAKDLLASLPQNNLAPVEASAGITLLPGDPHVWLSPLGAAQEMRNIAAGFARADAPHREDYEAALAVWEAECEALDAEYRAALALPSRRAFVTTHAAFGYLARDYGLRQVALGLPGSEDDPSPQEMRKAVDFLRAEGIKTVFYGDPESRKTAEAIAGELRGKAVRLNPLEGLTAEELAAGEDYFSVMRKNLVALREALE
jgi:zinc transport system substrate-binding protein